MGKERSVEVQLYQKPRNFAVNPDKMNQLADALREFMQQLLNDDGTSVVIPDYCNDRQYFVELIAGMATNLRKIGESMHPERVVTKEQLFRQ